MCARVLEHDGDLGAVLAEGVALESQDVGAVERDAALHVGAVGQQPRDRLGRHRLARAGLADQTHRLALRDRERRAGDDLARAGVHLQAHGEVADLEERAHRFTAFDEVSSRSPRKLTAATTRDDAEHRGDRHERVALQQAGLALADHDAPVGLRRLDAEAEERDGREVDHGEAEQDRALRDDEAGDVGKQVTNAEAPRAEALDLERRDVGHRPLLERRAAQHPGDVRRVRDRQRERRGEQRRAEHGGGEDREQDAGEGEDDVDADR